MGRCWSGSIDRARRRCLEGLVSLYAIDYAMLLDKSNSLPSINARRSALKLKSP